MESYEIKERIKMPEVVARYGIKIRGNMCSCPFHGKDAHPSMRVFNDGANCFTCNWNGDIFDFVMDMEKCTFKDAFLILGGTYKKSTKASKIIRNNKFESARNKLKKKEEERKLIKKEVSIALQILTEVIRTSETWSDDWCDAHTLIQPIEQLWDDLIARKEVDIDYANRKCSEVKCRFVAVG